MTALNVLIYPDDHLKVVCEPVTEVNDAIRKIVDDSAFAEEREFVCSFWNKLFS